jgi:hypothetical protein
MIDVLPNRFESSEHVPRTYPSGRGAKLAGSDLGSRLNAVGLPLFPVRKSFGEPEVRKFEFKTSNAASNSKNGRTSTEVEEFSAV